MNRRLDFERTRKRRRPRLPALIVPKITERSYFKEIRSQILEPLRKWLMRELDKALPAILAEADVELGRERSDAYGKTIAKLFGDLRVEFERRYPEDKAADVARKYGTRATEQHATQVGRQVKSVLGVDLLKVDPNVTALLNTFIAGNVDLIKTISTRYFSEIEDIVTEGARGGVSSKTLGKEIAERFEVSESRGRLIARDQIGKVFADVNQIRQTGLGISQYTWRTSLDERVRDSHQALEGEVFSWDSPPTVDGERVHPGQAIQCRCTAEPLIQV